MKNHLYFFAFAGALMLGATTGCGDNPADDPDPIAPERMAVNLRTDIAPASRVANDQWEAADRIGVYMKQAGSAITATGAVYAAANNIQMSVTGGMLTPASTLYYPLEGNVDFIGYYPYNASVQEGYKIPVDLAGQSGGLPVEVLYSNNASNKAPSSSAVALTFRYLLAKLEVTVTAAAGAGLTAADFSAMTASVEGMYTKADVNLKDGTFTGQQGYQPIALHRTGGTAASATFDALILPASPATDQVVFEFIVRGNSYRCTVNASYSAATRYALAFTLDIPVTPQPTATLLSTTITPRTTTNRSYTVTAPDAIHEIAVTAGQLQAQLLELTQNNLPAIKTLKLTGSLNATDFATLNALTALEALDMGGVTVPNGRIPNEAFKNNTRLKSVTLPASCTEIGNDAFYGCTALVGKLTIPGKVTLIESGAFQNCTKLTDLELGAKVQSIGIAAFYNCGFKGALVLPATLESIGNTAFYNCKFTSSLTIPGNVTSIGNEAFRGCSGFTGHLVIPNSVTSIGNDAFRDCSGFTGNLVISNSVTSVGSSTFYHCSGFTGNLVIPNSVTSISNEAFDGCSGFTGNLVIPNSMTSIGRSAFSNCSGFTGNLVIPNSMTSIGRSAFSNCSGFTGNLVIPNSVTSIDQTIFYGCSGFDGTLTLPVNASITFIPVSCFYGCKNLSGALVIPNNVKTISDNAFYECWSFSSLNLGTGVNKINALGFGNCSGLAGTVNVSAFAANVAADAFEGCTKLTVVR